MFQHFYRLYIIIILSGINLSSEAQANRFLPVPDHIVVVIMENHTYGSIIGNDSAAPNINAWARESKTALFTNSFAIEHPSQPNYLDLFSGSNQGVTHDTTSVNSPFTTPNLARALLDRSLSYISYSEGLPFVGYNGEKIGAYARKHNPVANWMGTGTNQVPPDLNRPFTDFPYQGFDSLPTVSYVIPNLVNDMHDGVNPVRINTGDRWLAQNLGAYKEWAKSHNSLLIITFDEDDYTGRNQIATMFIGAMVKGGNYNNLINHFNVKRTIEDMYSLPPAGVASESILNCWVNGIPDITVFPNPGNDQIQIILDFMPVEPVLLRFFDARGNQVQQVQVSDTQIINIPVKNWTQGFYTCQMVHGKESARLGKFIIAH
jgi:hypothetical protein